MVSTTQILDAVTRRLEFWREQQQSAFRGGDHAKAAMCARIIEEYGYLTAEAAGRIRRAPPSETLIKALRDCALI
jgi:hypothetical protein